MCNMKISIIVPVYNVEKYIKRCLDSLTGQDFEDYEIIVVDDGTPDRSMDYVIEQQKVYDNIIIVSRSNGGLSAARNTGLECAKGEYILFCDSDDALDHNCLRLLYQEAEKNELDLLLFDARTINCADGMERVIEGGPYDRTKIDDAVMTGTMMLDKLLALQEYRASACLYLIKNRVLKENSLTFYEGIIHEDELFTPKLILSANCVAHRNWLLYYRYEHRGSITNSDNFAKRRDSLAVVIKELEQWKREKALQREKKVLIEQIIIQHIKQVLVYYITYPAETEKEKEQKRVVLRIVRDNDWKFDLKYKLYLIKKRMEFIFVGGLGKIINVF